MNHDTQRTDRRKQSIWTWFGMLVLCIGHGFITSGFVAAGMSGENIIVIVNSDSLASRTVANHYVDLRDIPANNVIFLKEIPDGLSISLKDFKTKILQPILTTLEKRGLVVQTRCIAYSADFPTSVDIRPHYDRLATAQTKKLVGTLGSITGLTYFYKFVLADSELYLGLGTNLYARGKFDQHFVNPFQDENKATFDQALSDFKGESPEAAGQAFEQLFAKYPTLAPLAVLSARSFAKAKMNDAATKMIKLAIKSGWWSAEYLKDDATLLPLLDDANIQRILPVLANHPTHVQGPFSFSAVKGWTASGYPVRIDQGGMPYLMSCSLAIVHKQGNSLSESIAILQRAASADRTYPDGEFLFAGNGDVRATTRMPGVGDALLYLQTDGFQTDVFRSTLPTKAGKVAGLFVGAATIDLKNTKWKLQPGAIAETLTSTAGDFRHGSQTKLTEYLSAGAAMSSGTVMEPYSLQQKFPLAMMHGYYASGMTAMEAFYLSVQSPYQLLIAGDPACQPFATPPSDTLTISLADSDENKIHFQRKPPAAPLPPLVNTSPKSSPATACEIFIEGRLVKTVPAMQSINMNIAGDLSGVLNIRATLVGFDASEPRRSIAKQVQIKSELPTPTATILVGREELDRSNRELSDDGSQSEPITIQLNCAGAQRIQVTHHSEVVATLNGSSGAVKVDTSKLGGGPLRLRPVATVGKQRIFGYTITN